MAIEGSNTNASSCVGDPFVEVKVLSHSGIMLHLMNRSVLRAGLPDLLSFGDGTMDLVSLSSDSTSYGWSRFGTFGL